MNARTKVSGKWQVVIPKQVRDRYRIEVGDTLDVVELPDGMLLRPHAAKGSETFEEITARIRSRVTYDGPPVSIEEMNETIAEEWARSGARGDW